ncbi:hypothetical protein [Sphingomonas sp. CFBP 8765]|uniref:hypothetical protein n=1 Tax=Sphingomonas sp. CFBP 8765 TaxID=2775274 RepID=UPI0017860E5C|nr:hypothetical protein [Sphingomonas sp. CFBP 8765]MBD8469443.1 hypothetical protein [Sphingomonas sp. CFBP 8765]
MMEGNNALLVLIYGISATVFGGISRAVAEYRSAAFKVSLPCSKAPEMQCGGCNA